MLNVEALQELLQKCVANFAQNGLSEFRITLKVSRKVLKHPHLVQQTLFADNTPHEFRELRVKGSGKFSGNFPDYAAGSFLKLDGGQVMHGKFRVNYLMDFLRDSEQIFRKHYPFFFPNWMASPLFKTINVCITRYEVNYFRLEMRSKTHSLRKDQTATVTVDGLLELSTFGGDVNVKHPIRLIVPDCPIKMADAELLSEWSS